MNQKLVNFGLFQAIYFACVLGARDGRPWIGALAALLLLPCNLWFFRKPLWAAEIRLWATAGLIGLVVDSGLYSAGVIAFPSAALPLGGGGAWAFIVPPWIVVLWVTVGSTLNGSLGWLRGRMRLAALLGAVGGPLSFWSGQRLDATALPLNAWSFLALAIEYAVLFPILLKLAERFGDHSAPMTDAL